MCAQVGVATHNVHPKHSPTGAPSRDGHPVRRRPACGRGGAFTLDAFDRWTASRCCKQVSARAEIVLWLLQASGRWGEAAGQRSISTPVALWGTRRGGGKRGRRCSLQPIEARRPTPRADERCCLPSSHGSGSACWAAKSEVADATLAQYGRFMSDHRCSLHDCSETLNSVVDLQGIGAG